MRVRMTISTVWVVDKKDEKIARKLIREKPKDYISDYLQGSSEGYDDLEGLEVEVEEI
jgi:hypothetical protein